MKKEFCVAEFSSLSKEELELLLMSMKKELDNTRSELSNAKNELNAAKDEISTKAKELDKAKDEISTKTKELDKAKIEIDDKTKELNKAKEEINNKTKELEQAQLKIRALNEEVNSLVKEYEAKKEVANKLIVEKFMPSSEKLNKNIIINELEKITSEPVRRNSPYKQIVNDLKKLQNIEEIVIDYDFKANGLDRNKVKPFGEDESYKLEVKPIEFKAVKVTRKKYKDKENIYEPLSDDIFPHSPLTASLASNIITMKYQLGIPFYRYANYLNTKGIAISDTDIGNWAAKAIDRLDPLYELLKKKLFNTSINVIHIDETPIKIIDEKKNKCYMFAYASTVWDSPILIYDFNSTRKCGRTAEFLKDYKGYIEVDGYSGYNMLKKQGIKVAKCMAHSRRMFNDVIKQLKTLEEIKTSPALEVIKIMAKLYKHEARFKKDNLTPSQIYKERNSDYYLKVIEELDLKINSIDISISNLMKKAVNYYKNQRNELFTYLESGYLPIDNNRIERDAIKVFVICRKNFLFCKNANGAEKTAKIFSIVQTARANGLKVEEYLKYLIENIDKVELEKLLPWHKDLPDKLRIHPDEI